MPSALTPIAWQSLGSTTATVTFSSIPGTYRDLYLVISATSGYRYTGITMNSDTGTNYSNVWALGDGSAATSSSNSSSAFYIGAGGTTSVANLVIINIMDYSATDKHKSVLVRNNISDAQTWMSAHRWANTAAVTRLDIVPSGAALGFAAGSTFALYGVSA